MMKFESGRKGEIISYDDIPNVRNKMKEFLYELNAKHNYMIFGYEELSITNNIIFTGSFGFYESEYHSLIFNEDEVKINDIDLIYPNDCSNMLIRFLEEKKIEYKKHGNQISCLIPLLDNKLFKVDFELKDFNGDNEPIWFSIFSNSYNYYDYVDRIKGCFHKILLSSLTVAHDEYYAFSVMNGLRTRHSSDRIGIKNMNIFVGLFFGNIHIIKNKHEVNEFIKNNINSFFNFRGICLLMYENFTNEQIDKVLSKFVRKVNEKAYEPDMLEKVKRIIHDVLGRNIHFSNVRSIQSVNDRASESS